MATHYKILAQTNPSATTLTDSYTVGFGLEAIVSSIVVANRSATPTTFRISVAQGGAADNNKQYIAYDAPLGANEIWGFTIGLTLQATDVIRVYAGAATVSFNIFGEEVN